MYEVIANVQETANPHRIRRLYLSVTVCFGPSRPLGADICNYLICLSFMKVEMFWVLLRLLEWSVLCKLCFLKHDHIFGPSIATRKVHKAIWNVAHLLTAVSVWVILFGTFSSRFGASL